MNARLHGWNSPVATVTTRILPPGTSSTCALPEIGVDPDCARTTIVVRSATAITMWDFIGPPSRDWLRGNLAHSGVDGA